MLVVRNSVLLDSTLRLSRRRMSRNKKSKLPFSNCKDYGCTTANQQHLQHNLRKDHYEESKLFGQLNKHSSFSMLTYNTIIYFFMLVTFVPRLVYTLQLPIQQQQQQLTDLDINSLQLQQETRCLSCIRSVTSAGLDLTKQRCEGYYCGPYQFSYQYWAEAGKPGNSQGVRDFEKCARDKQCAESTVKAYFKKFKRDCNNDGLVDCLDMAALHKVGPQSCSLDWFYKSRYWQAFNKTTCATTTRDNTNSSSPFSTSSSTLSSSSSSSSPSTSSSSSTTTTALSLNRNSYLDQHRQQQPQVIMKNQTLTSECLDCICEALTSCSSSQSQLNTSNCGSGTVCGPFAISQQYWKDGRRPGASWTACARTKECSSVTIRNYMDKYKRDCNGDSFVTCEDYAAIHRRGPKSCMNRDLLKEQFWLRFLACRSNQKPNNDANLVKLGNDDGSAHQIALATSVLASRGASSTIPNVGSGAGSNAGASISSTTQQTTAATSSIASTPAAPQQASFTPSLAQTSSIATRFNSRDQMNNNNKQQQHSISQPIHNRHESNSAYDQPLLKSSVRVSPATSLATPTPIANPGHHNQHQHQHISSSITYEDLSPIHLTEIKQQSQQQSSTTNTQQVKTYQVVKMTTTTPIMSMTTTEPPQRLFSYENNDNNNSDSDNQREKNRFIVTHKQSSVTPHYDMPVAHHTLTRGPITSSQHEQQHEQQQQQTTNVYQEYSQEPHTNVLQQQQQQQQSRAPIIDYNSLPIIIVSKPLGQPSANRMSQAPPLPTMQPARAAAPQESFVESQTPAFQTQTITSMTTTMSPASSIQTVFQSMTTMPSYVSSETETSATSTVSVIFSTLHNGASDQTSTSSGAAHLAPPNSAANSQELEPLNGNMENAMSDFESNGAAAAGSSFDRVVTGIVGSPDFSKAYPPMPELVQQRKQPAPSRSPTSLSPKISSPAMFTTASISKNFDSTTTAGKVLINKETGKASHSTQAAPISTGGNKRENSKTLSPNIYAISGGGGGGGDDISSNLAHQVHLADPASVLLGPDALNMTSLFEKGALNETSRIPSECLDCICDASSNCDTTVQCISKQREKNRCGMYMISWNQYKESDIALTSLVSSSASSEHQGSGSGGGDDYDEKLYYDCSTDKNCAEKLIHLYIEKYSKDCNHDGKIDCYDIAAIHRVGPDNCNSHKFLSSQYWRDFNHCYATDRLTTTTVQPQASISSQGVS